MKRKRKNENLLEENGHGLNLQISDRDGRKRNQRELRYHKNRWKEMELEGTWKSQCQMEGTETERNLKISKIDGKNWNWKEPRNLKNRWKEMELKGSCKNTQYTKKEKRPPSP